MGLTPYIYHTIKWFNEMSSVEINSETIDLVKQELAQPSELPLKYP